MKVTVIDKSKVYEIEPESQTSPWDETTYSDAQPSEPVQTSRLLTPLESARMTIYTGPARKADWGWLVWTLIVIVGCLLIMSTAAR